MNRLTNFSLRVTLYISYYNTSLSEAKLIHFLLISEFRFYIKYLTISKRIRIFSALFRI